MMVFGVSVIVVYIDSLVVVDFVEWLAVGNSLGGFNSLVVVIDSINSLVVVRIVDS